MDLSFPIEVIRSHQWVNRFHDGSWVIGNKKYSIDTSILLKVNKVRSLVLYIVVKDIIFKLYIVGV